MLDGFARHGLFDLSVSVDGDLDIDGHTRSRTPVSCSELQSARQSATNRASAATATESFRWTRHWCSRPLTSVGRPYLSFQAEFTREKVGEMETEMVKEFFYAVSYAAQMNLHIKVLDGGNNHHIIERCSKHLRRHSMRQLPSIRELPACSRPRAACKSRKRGEQDMKQALNVILPGRILRQTATAWFRLLYRMRKMTKC